MQKMEITIPDDACGKAGAFFNVFMMNGFGDLQWCATFEGDDGFEDAVDVADGMARAHKTQAWIVPAFYSVDGRNDERDEYTRSAFGKICRD